MTVHQYLDNINKRYQLGNATEHTFRGDLQQLIESIVPEVRATNEPKRQSCGAPDYILTKKDVPVGFIEAKDIGDKDLEGKKKTGNKEQFDRYKASLNNLIFTDYLDFHLYRDGHFVTSIAIAQVVDNSIQPITENFVAFENLIKEFTVHISQTIKSPKRLAEMMAGKARLLSDVIGKALTSDETHQEDSTLKEQMHAFKDILIHDITPKGFADVYAQTIAYGMFAARLHDPTLGTFSRQEAAELIPKSNPFLRKLFGYIAGPDIDDRIKWIVDNLTEIFLACNVEDILKNYGKATKMEDPIIHFYETFLSEYDPKLRKARGVWYTPAPVVNFIVRAVDDILKSEFGLPQGLADTSKTTVKMNTQIPDKTFKSGYKQYDQEVHKVQILDPATGTGTFLAEVIKHIHKKFKGQEGIWSGYVENQLLPRLNGFELLMASYAMAHLQIDLLLKDTGYKPVIASAARQSRTRIYLTNSLEEYHPDTGTLFANWLSSEANEANQIKRDTPVMCVIGNPPYSGESANKGEWIMNLMEDYKKEPGGKEKLKEKNSKSINADEYKFIRYAQHFIDKNDKGVIAFINPHTYLDAPLFRGMRWNLLKSFDKIYTIDLHGNSTKKEVAPDGGADDNVFDIRQGVSINILVKTGQKNTDELGQVYHYDLYGKRDKKYNFLYENTIKSIKFENVKIESPHYYFKPQDLDKKEDYLKGFEVVKLMPFKTSGIKTHDDKNLVANDILNLEQNIEMLGKDFIFSKVYKYSYRPFDNGYIYYDTTLLGRAREKTIYHLKHNNIGLILVSQPQAANINYFDCLYVTSCLTDTNMYRRGGPSTFPLYLYPESTDQQSLETQLEHVPNFDMKIIKEFEKQTGLHFRGEDTDPNVTVEANTFSPEELLHYIYAVLHSPTYRETYKEFLKIDFPRVPYPKDPKTFYDLAHLGSQLTALHLLESPTVEDYITTYPIDGNNIVEKPHFVTSSDFASAKLYREASAVDKSAIGAVYINETQYFDNVPKTAWEFYIGGYQPAQKWLKDRKERTLSYEDIFHYQKIIVALTETARIMGEIDKIEI
ncbi:MAG: type ISP restriction/modification enzyme [Gelidibacter sp.]